MGNGDFALIGCFRGLDEGDVKQMIPAGAIGGGKTGIILREIARDKLCRNG